MARENLRIKVGTYTGDGVDSRNVTGVGFRPDLVIIKGGNNIAAFRTDKMQGDSSNLLAGSGAQSANIIQEILNDGFQLGTSANVNTNATVYYYIAIKGTSSQTNFRTGIYRGNATDNRDYTGGGLGFTPDFVTTKINGATVASFRTSSMIGDTSGYFTGSANAANTIQSLISNGFQLGTASEANGNFDYFFFAMKQLSGCIAVGSYVGDGLDDKAITGLGFSPSAVIVKNGATTTAARLLTSDMVTNGQTSVYLITTATDANGIKTLDSNGFTVGTGTSVNGSGNTCYWIALKAGSYNAPLNRTAA